MEELFEKLKAQVEALENQSYILYLQLNALTKQLLESGAIDKEKLTKDMDDLNDQLYNIAKEQMDTAAPAEETE
jgi:polyhydroxyalkanoate synthesis regulator phasin